MRTDAKIGFAIFGVLVAVLIGFFVVNSRHNGSQARNTKPVIIEPEPKLSVPGNGDPVQPKNPEPPVTLTRTDAQSGLLPDPTKPPVASNTGTTNTGTGDMLPPFDPIPPVGNKSGDGSLTNGTAKVKDSTRSGSKHAGDKDAGKLHDATTITAKERTYTVRAGQTLTSIASDVYGDPQAWKLIKNANPDVNPLRMRVGQKIKIPDQAVARSRPGNGARPAPARGVVTILPDYIAAEHPGIANMAAVSLASDPAGSYTVRDGDSLYKIAKRVLGSGQRADELFELNRDVIGSAPSKLKLGMVLRLPASPIGELSDASR